MNWENRTLYRGDNLEFMRSMNSNSVHLIATDPPFNKGRDFHATPESLASGASFSDRWRWDEDVQPDWLDQIQDDWPAAWAVIDSSRATYGDDMAAFLCFMAVRLMAMRRVLREDGSIYLHCDPTASHYLKTLMDAIFGRKQFRNEVTWKRSAGRAKGSQHAPRRFGSDTDTLFFYTKGSVYTFHGCYSPLTEEEIGEMFPYEDERGRYNTNVPLFRQPSMGARPNLCYEYRGVRNPHPSGWRVGKERLIEMDGRNEIIWRDGKRPLRKTYADSYKGRPRGNLWDDIPNITGGAEATSYPTQKPLALYRRIILASSNPGDIVFDPFAGCATTSVAAEMEGRRWVACDEWEGAYDVVKQRLESMSVGAGRDAMSLYPIMQRSEPLVRTDSGETSAPPLKSLRRKASPPRMKRSEMMAVLVERDGMRCQGCGRGFDSQRYLELDHKMPRSEGGSNEIENRVLLCGPCNRTKSNTLTLTGLRKQNRKDGFLAAPLK